MSRASLVINKRKSSTATLRRYITKPPRVYSCPQQHTHIINMSGRGKGGKVRLVAL